MESLVLRLFPKLRPTWALHRRQALWLVYGSLGYMGLWALLVLYAWTRGWAPYAMRSFVFIGTPTGLAYAGGWLLMWRLDLRMRARARSANWRLCSGCGYDLRGAAESGICPECGLDYNVETLERAWSKLGERASQGGRSHLRSRGSPRPGPPSTPGSS